jgi:hypothetical protein
MVTREIQEPPENFAVDRRTLAYIIEKARAFDGLVASSDPSDGSDAADDRFVDALEDESDNPVQRELGVASGSRNVDAKTTLVALAWLGRDDYEAGDWLEAFGAARERAETSTARYLMGMPLLGDYLESGADKLGINLLEEHEEGFGDPDIDTRGGER